MMIFSYTTGMNTLAERLKFALQEKPNLSKTGLWKACKLSSGAVTHWFNGSTKELKGDNLINAANYLGVSPTWLTSGKAEPSKTKQSAVDYEIDSKDEYLRQIIYFYNGMKIGHKEALLHLANQLHGIDNPNDRLSTPYPKKPRKQSA